jgi:inorganic pyrophosphatase/exopolyphosphatase
VCVVNRSAKADIGHLNTGQLLIKDYKQWEKLGISSVTGLSLASNLTKRVGFKDAVDAFVKERDLELFCLMTGCNHGDARGFERELLLVGKDAEKVVEMIREELKLEGGGDPSILLFNQRNLSARFVY